MRNHGSGYSRSFEKKGPHLESFLGNVEFRVGEHWVQITSGKVKKAAIMTTEIKTVPNLVSFFDLKDLDGKMMKWFQVLTKAPKVTGNRN